MKRMAVILMVVSALLAGAWAQGREISAQTSVTKWGQLPEYFEIAGQALPEGATASDFTITGAATAWGTSSLHSFACEVAAVEATEDGWRLIPRDFPDKFFYVRRLEVSCPGHPELGFSLEDISRTLTRTADAFADYRDRDSQLDAHVFLPDAEAPVPAVIVFHGYGNTENLLTYRTSVVWAETENQAVRPCAVIAPTIPDALYTSEFVRQRVFEGVLAWVDAQAEAGRIDPKRIYSVGNSFGGMSAIELAEQHPERIAGVLALCPALNYSAHCTQRLSELTDVPVTLVQAEHDETIPVSVSLSAADTLRAAGNANVVLRVYSDEEMTAAGAVLGQENTYSFHHVELAAMEGAEYEGFADWLFGLSKD